MAEFPDLGKNCAFGECNELDFLPFHCSYCQKTFCSKHRLVADHNCEPWNEIQKNNQAQPSEGSTFESFKCNANDCDRKDLVQVLCRLCENHFCLQHRHEYDHNCSKIEKVESKPSKAAEFIKSLKKDTTDRPAAKSKPSSKQDGLAAKVNYMKLKQSAVGDRTKIPEEERVYFYIELPESYLYKNSNTMPIVFSKVQGSSAPFVYFRFYDELFQIWSVGKCIDLAASFANVPNRNNIANSKKLRFFTNDEIDAVQLQVDESVEKLIADKLICDAQTLRLLYI